MKTQENYFFTKIYSLTLANIRAISQFSRISVFISVVILLIRQLHTSFQTVNMTTMSFLSGAFLFLNQLLSSLFRGEVSVSSKNVFYYQVMWKTEISQYVCDVLYISLFGLHSHFQPKSKRNKSFMSKLNVKYSCHTGELPPYIFVPLKTLNLIPDGTFGS